MVRFQQLVVFSPFVVLLQRGSFGPDNGWKHLIDSNIDWGQDMWLLKEWVAEHEEARPLSIAYCNYIDYKIIVGMDFPEPPPDPPSNLRASGPEMHDMGPHAGYFAVDIHNLVLGPYTYFQKMIPIGKVGYSIFIYRLTQEQADEARRQMRLLPLYSADQD